MYEHLLSLAIMLSRDTQESLCTKAYIIIIKADVEKKKTTKNLTQLGIIQMRKNEKR